jgi:hypothetical protein
MKFFDRQNLGKEGSGYKIQPIPVATENAAHQEGWRLLTRTGQRTLGYGMAAAVVCGVRVQWIDKNQVDKRNAGHKVER